MRSSAVNSSFVSRGPVPIEIEVKLSVGGGVVAVWSGLEARQVLEIGTDMKRQHGSSRFR
jgi:hypothetical protein